MISLRTTLSMPWRTRSDDFIHIVKFSRQLVSVITSPSLVNILFLIRQFGAPNGLFKEPWRRSSKFNALGQMLCTNTRLDQLAAACADFTERGMLDGTGASSYATYFEQLTCPDCNHDCDDTMDAGMDAMDEDEDEDDVRVAEGDDDDNDNGVVEGPVANCDVKLACTIAVQALSN
ncbi:hypothetical protein EV424DRAFT_1413060 [Suillus variegatus]|nr:hypothetical protein EV424DRAFT_1413060 [Suillus variegatus]